MSIFKYAPPLLYSVYIYLIDSRSNCAWHVFGIDPQVNHNNKVDVMEIKRTLTECGDLIVKLIGDLDALSVAEIRADFESIAVGKQPQIVLDLEQVEFIDSSGIGAIVFLYKRLKEEGRALELMGARGQPKHLLELLRIHQVISIR